MEYRRLGDSGVKLSVLSLGSWLTFGERLDEDSSLEAMQAAHDAGVNFFDNAEAYGAGRSERLMGAALARLGWPRHSYLVSTKFFWGIHDGPNTKHTLNRKYLSQAIDGSLERLQLDFVDLVFCHRPDPATPIEETVWTMSDIVSSGKALYWGTSEWSADEIRAAWDIADRHHLHKPQMEQPRYNLLSRERVEREYSRLYSDIGLGTTTFSPLASGQLTGKYLHGVPSGSRAESVDWMSNQLSDPATNAKIEALGVIAEDLGCSTAQLALAWCASNPNVSSVITGATSVEQVKENMGALEVRAMLDGDVMERIESALVGVQPL